jgi:putative ABC transport system permease protein
MTMLGSYLKLAWKVLQRRRFFTFASLFGVSFTLLVLCVAAAALDHMFGPHPPETRIGRTLGVYGLAMSSDTPDGGSRARTGFPGYRFLDLYLRDLPGAEKVAIFQLQRGVDSYLGTRKISSYLKRTDGAYWQILDFQFLEGQPFSEEDERQARPVAVINERTRERFFGGAPAVGRTIEVDGQRFRVVGVVPDVSLLRVVAFADVWVPISTARSDAYKREDVADFMGLVLAPPERFDLLRREFAERVARAESADPATFDTFHGGLETFFEFASRMLLSTRLQEARPGTLRALLAGAALLFMLLPAINLVNLNLSRILERGSEIGVRKAFGASSRTLIGQFVVEGLVLSLLGGVLALLLCFLTLRAINASGLIPYAQLTLNPRVFLWGLLFATVFGLLSGLYPAWRMARLHPVESLRGRSL